MMPFCYWIVTANARRYSLFSLFIHNKSSYVLQNLCLWLGRLAVPGSVGFAFRLRQRLCKSQELCRSVSVCQRLRFSCAPYYFYYTDYVTLVNKQFFGRLLWISRPYFIYREPPLPVRWASQLPTCVGSCQFWSCFAVVLHFYNFYKCGSKTYLMSGHTCGISFVVHNAYFLGTRCIALASCPA